jgi:hypothetical protein
METKEESENRSDANNNFSELQWLTNVELFDMLDSGSQGSIGFREFCSLIYLVAAVQSN